MKVFYHVWAWRPFRSCYKDTTSKLSLFISMEAPHKICFDWPSGFEKIFEIVNGRMDKCMLELTLDHGYTISSSCEPAAQVSLNGLSKAFIITYKMTFNHDLCMLIL